MRSPCSFAVRMRAMTCGRLTRVSSSSSARSRASPSGVSASAATTGAGGAATAVEATGAFAARGARGAAGRRLGAGGSPRAPSASPSATRTTRVGGQRRDHRFGDQRAFQPGRLAFAGRAAQVRPRKHDAPVGEGGQVRLGDAGGERGEQGVLVFLGRGGRRPPDLQAIERAQRLEPVPAGRRPPVAELGLGHRRHATRDRGVRGADVQDGLRREPERAEARRQRPWTSAPRHRGAVPRPARSTCRRGSARSVRTPAEPALRPRRPPVPGPGPVAPRRLGHRP